MKYDDTAEDNQMSGGYFQQGPTPSTTMKKLRTKSSQTSVPNYSILKEYQMLSEYNPQDNTTVFTVMANTLDNDTWELLDLEAARVAMNSVFHYLNVAKRFRKINEQSGDTVSYSTEGFHIGESTFATLDEVEKALKNKAFL